jgi:hypothetical protein
LPLVQPDLHTASDRRIGAEVLLTGTPTGVLDCGASLDDAGDRGGPFEVGAALGERSYGKGAMVGINGEMEHGGACVHPMLGRPMRAAIGGGKAVIG